MTKTKYFTDLIRHHYLISGIYRYVGRFDFISIYQIRLPKTLNFSE